ncbi:hypothetical protein DL89DRAFT_5147 [Linderina pennispora]|uniref:Uncharacterized protein n=1 Tax=Linderina pennispora TaxID=61395 RepID=A0A1Y1WL91_9FUNG|nr:uncharacterized protein DL89DRAFT_5147 [Linderina pennispora]ORX73864.1 hypothetical protein DL89DRAFT_5147 [Linderina pennispora]
MRAQRRPSSTSRGCAMPTTRMPPALTDDQVAQEIEDVYCDPGFRDGLLFNASSDRLPARLNADPPAWLRVTVRIPEPDSKFSISIRAVNASGYEVVSILPGPRLSFRGTNSASFVIRPLMPGHFTLHFAAEGAHARYYHPIPSRTLVVEGAFMRHTVQVGWRKEAERRAWYMFGMDSKQTKAMWARCLKTAVKQAAGSDSADSAVKALTKDGDQVVSGLELVTMMGGSL